MPIHSRRHELYRSFRLILCIALGLWLGAVAIALTGLLLYHTLPAAQTRTVTEVTQRVIAPQAPTPATATSSGAMFDTYQQALRDSEARQAREYAEAEQRKHFNRAKCDFWMQQDRTAPSDKSRAGINEFCG